MFLTTIMKIYFPDMSIKVELLCALYEKCYGTLRKTVILLLVCFGGERSGHGTLTLQSIPKSIVTCNLKMFVHIGRSIFLTTFICFIQK